MFRGKLYIIIFIFFWSLIEGNAQNEVLVTPKLDSILNLVDKEIGREEFKQVTLIIDSLKQIKAYKKNKLDRLAIDLRYAQLLYKRKEDQKAVHLLLNGLDQLKNYPKSKLIWNYYVILYRIHRQNNNYSKAFIYNNKSLANAIYRKDTLSILRSYRMKYLIFYYLNIPLKENNEAYQNYVDSMESISRIIISFPLKSDTQKILARTFMSLSILEGDRGNYEISNDLINKSLDIKKKLNDTIELAVAILNLGGNLYTQKKYVKAIDTYKKSIELVKNISRTKTVEIQRASFQNISWAYNELKKYKLAYEYQEKAEVFSDSLLEINKVRDIAAIEAKYLEAQKTEVEKNKRLKTQLYFLSFGLLTLIIGILGYMIYNRLLNKQRKTERKISGLKYKALNAQMSPHFINNLLLCIHDLIDTNEKKIAIESLNKFNRLTNLVLRSTKSNLIALSKEIEMLELYMDLQLLRFDNKFEYFINTNEISKKGIDRIQIPPIILQPLVENSIVHGFRNMEIKGKLVIDFVLEDDDSLICTITDNGKETPENLSPEMYTKNGISLKNISERLELISQEKTNKKLVVLTKVKNESNQEIGFKTELNIPLIYN